MAGGIAVEKFFRREAKGIIGEHDPKATTKSLIEVHKDLRKLAHDTAVLLQARHHARNHKLYTAKEVEKITGSFRDIYKDVLEAKGYPEGTASSLVRKFSIDLMPAKATTPLELRRLIRKTNPSVQQQIVKHYKESAKVAD
ncbi:MAG: hypothetical protein V1811_00120 [Candidatus Micrarchaeota archaeon]